MSDLTAGRRRMFRHPEDRMLGGVCAGVALHVGIDPTLVRVLTVVGSVIFFPVVPLVYLLLWVLIPEGVRVTPGGVPPAPGSADRTASD